MVLRLEKIKLINFKTYQDSNFTFSEGHNVILGENGSGKSSIFEAITYALFGSVPGKTISGLIRHGTRKMEVTMEFSVNDKDFHVERTATKSVGTALLTEKNGKRIAEKAKAVNEEIEKNLGIGQRVFSNVVYIPQGSIAAIASERPSERRELFDKILGYYLYKRTSDRLRVIEKSAELSITGLKARIRDFKDDIKQKEILETELEDLENHVIILNKQLVELQPKLENTTEKFNEMNKEREEINQIEVRIRTQETEIQTRSENLSKLIVSLEENIKKALPTTDAEFLELKIEMQEKLKHLDKIIEKTSTKVDSGKKVENTIGELRKRNESSENQIQKIQDQIHGFRNGLEVGDLEPQKYLNDLRAQLKQISKKKERLDSKIKSEIEQDKQLSILLEKKSQSLIEIEKMNLKITEIEKNISKILPNWEDAILTLLKRDIQQEKLDLSHQVKDKRDLFAEVQSRIISLKDLRKKENTLMKALEGSGISKCPLCSQEMNAACLKKVVAEKKRLLTEISTKGKKLTKEKKKLENEVVQLEESRKTLDSDDKTKIKVDALFSNHEELVSEKKKVERELTSTGTQIKKLKNKITSITKLEEKIILFEKSAKDIDNQIRNLENSLLLSDQLKDMRTQFEETQKQIEEKQNDFNLLELEENVQVLTKQKSDQKMMLITIPRVETIINEKESLEKTKESNNETLVELKTLKEDFNEIAFNRLKNRVEKLKEKTIQKETQVKTIQKQQIPDKKKQLREITKKEKKLKEVKRDQEITNKKLTTIGMVRDFTKQIVPILRRQHVMAISEYSSEIFSYLMNNEEYEGIEITEDYELRILQSGKKYDLTILSGGEQVISCLAIRLAIAKLLANQDIMLLDEPTVMLDNYRRKELVEVFDKTKPVRQTIIVTHDTEFERVADSTFTVVKRAGKAKVIAEEIDHIVSQQKKYQALTQERFQQLEI